MKPTHFKIELQETTDPKQPWIGFVKIVMYNEANRMEPAKVIHFQPANNQECFDELKKIAGTYKVVK